MTELTNKRGNFLESGGQTSGETKIKLWFGGFHTKRNNVHVHTKLRKEKGRDRRACSRRKLMSLDFIY